MKIKVKLRGSHDWGKEFENVSEGFIADGFLIIGCKDPNEELITVQYEPIPLVDIDYWREIKEPGDKEEKKE